LRRLAIVFAVELRLKIVTELFQREMSPAQFHGEFGGGTLSRVDQNFKRLKEHNWLRETGTKGPGEGRRGGVEHFFRATELAYFNQETWAVLPYSIRVAFSWNIFGQIGARLREALEIEVREVGRPCRFTADTVLLDQVGRERVITAVVKVFESIYELQDDARMRACRTGEQLIRANVVQLAFDSPVSNSVHGSYDQRFAIEEPLAPLLLRAAKIFADELCLEIIEAANERAISATEFHREFGGDLGKVRRQFRKAADNGWLKEVDWKTGGKRHGATEKFYGATLPALANADELLANVPASLERTEKWKTFEHLHAVFLDAMKAGTVDARVDRCLAWSMLQLDRVGWRKVNEALQELRALVHQEQKLAASRMAETGEKPIAMALAFASFISSPEVDWQP
jgi:hypothetical protein